MPKASVLRLSKTTADILNLLKYNLQTAGFDVLSSDNGYDGLSVARQHLPDLVVLDLMLPGLDGLEVCRELKRSAETKRIPVIILTGARR